MAVALSHACHTVVRPSCSSVSLPPSKSHIPIPGTESECSEGRDGGGGRVRDQAKGPLSRNISAETSAAQAFWLLFRLTSRESALFMIANEEPGAAEGLKIYPVRSENRNRRRISQWRELQ